MGGCGSTAGGAAAAYTPDAAKGGASGRVAAAAQPKTLAAGGKRMSTLSDSALKQLSVTNEELMAIEASVARIEKSLLDQNVAAAMTPAALGAIKTELAQLEAKANKLETKGIDDVYTGELKSGKDQAKAEKKALLKRLEALFAHIERSFGSLSDAQKDAAPAATGNREKELPAQPPSPSRSSSNGAKSAKSPTAAPALGDAEEAAADAPRPKKRAPAERRMSDLSDLALQQLTATGEELAAVEARVAEIEKSLQDPGLAMPLSEMGAMKTELAQLEAKANKIETKGVDEVYTGELETGKDQAKAEKKALLARLEKLFQKIEDTFGVIKEKSGPLTRDRSPDPGSPAGGAESPGQLPGDPEPGSASPA